MTLSTRRVWLSMWPIAACVVVLCELGFWIHGSAPRETFPLDLSVSSVSICVGLVLWRLRPSNRTGVLLALAGLLWAIGSVHAYENPWAIAVGDWLGGWQLLVFAHLLLAYPTGRLGSRRLRLLVGAGYGLILVGLAVQMTGPSGQGAGAFAVWHAPAVSDTLATVVTVAGGMYALIGIVIFARRWLHATAAGRRVLGPVLAAALVFAATIAVDQGVNAVTGSEPGWVFYPPVVAQLLIPFAFLFGLMRERLGQVAVGDLVIDLDATGIDTLEGALARTLADPSLQLGYRIAGSDSYVDADGRPLALPAEGDQRAATRIERDGQELAVIVHDKALLETPQLVKSAVAAARLALDNERLQAQLRAQLVALRASRARLVQTADAERRRLERDLHDGAQQRMLALGLALQLMRSHVEHDPAAASLLAEAQTELQHSLRELRELARGIHPAILTDQGLASAARTLASRAPIPVTVSSTEKRFPPAIETAAYFVIAEALTNIAKYADASKVSITIGQDNGYARIDVHDDGIGGADPAKGSGLAGLADRIGALDGRLTISSDARAGTCITAQIPCA